MVSLSNPFNLGARNLNAILKEEGYDTHLVFLGDIVVNDLIRPTAEEIDTGVNLIVDEIKPDVVGISVSCSAFYKDAVTLSQKLREHHPGLIIMWGGIHVFLRPQDCIDHADLCFTGEAEIQLVEAMKVIEETGNIPAGLDGTWAKVNGTVHRNPYGRIVEDLDTIPFPDYDNERKYVIRGAEVHREEPFHPQVYSLFVISSEDARSIAASARRRNSPRNTSRATAPAAMSASVRWRMSSARFNIYTTAFPYSGRSRMQPSISAMMSSCSMKNG